MSDSIEKALEHFIEENEMLKSKLNKTKNALKKLLIENGECPSSAGLENPPNYYCELSSCKYCRTQAVDKI